MSSTTLITFLFEAPSSAITVELVGSWDRFTKSYPLSRDSRTGPAHWRGCHTFTNITCDGDSNDMSASRDGGLKMGGKYWYFYRLDGDVEYHNPVEPSTDLCPFLPGQRVNILEVPVQEIESRTRSGSSSSIGSAVYTLDPTAKYLKPQPSVRRTLFMSSFNKGCNASTAALPDDACTLTAKTLQRENISTIVYRERTKIPKAALTRKAQSSGSPTKRLLSAAFSKMRLTRSAGLAGGSEYPNVQHDYPPYPRTSKATPSTLETSSSPVTHVKSVLCALDYKTCSKGGEEFIQDIPTREGSIPASPCSHTSPLEQLRKQNSFFENLPTHDQDRSTLGKGASDEESDLHHDDIYGGSQSYAGSVSSYTTNNLSSPGLGSSFVHTEGMSPFHLSQPDTPSISEFGDDVLETGLLSKSETHVTSSAVHGVEAARDCFTSSLRDKRYADFRGFQGYSLPETEQASTLTLRNIPSLVNLGSRGSSTPYGNQGSKALVSSWNDGAEHRMTALEELVDDLGYLGELII